MRHPRDMGAADVQAFLTMLASERHVSSSTHNQALSALLFLYRDVLNTELPWMQNIQRPQQPKRIPSVLTQAEVGALMAQMQGTEALLARLLYGTGMRLMEGIRLRIKDVDFDRKVIVVRQAKGNKDRVVMLPHSLLDTLRQQLLHARAVWEKAIGASWCRGARRAGGEIPQGRPKLGVVLAVSGAGHQRRPTQWSDSPPPCV